MFASLQLPYTVYILIYACVINAYVTQCICVRQPSRQRESGVQSPHLSNDLPCDAPTWLSWFVIRPFFMGLIWVNGG